MKGFTGHAARLKALEAAQGRDRVVIRVEGGLPAGWKPPSPEESAAALAESERLRDAGGNRVFKMPKP
jgi:hypothetical protein